MNVNRIDEILEELAQRPDVTITYVDRGASWNVSNFKGSEGVSYVGDGKAAIVIVEFEEEL
jgi:hypothetical protein